MPNRLFIFPEFTGMENACDILNRISWGLYGLRDDTVSLYVSEENIQDVPSISECLRAPTLSVSQENYLSYLPPILKQPKTLEVGAEDFGLFWDYSAYSNLPTSLSSRNKILIDPNYYFNQEADQIAALQYTILSDEQRIDIRESSRRRYAKFLARWAGVESAYLYLTGPTVETALRQSVDRSAIQIICNSLVKNTVLLQKIQPDVLMFSDPAYHFGISKYASSFRAYVQQTMKDFPSMICMVPETYYPLTVGFLGDKVSQRIIGIPLEETDEFHFPSIEEFYLRKTGNILTSMMVPVASGIAKRIYMLGADGRASSDKGYWSHARSSQISDQLRTIYDAHPSLGRDEDVEKYYEEHVKLLEAQLTHGETIQNKEYKSLTPSMIPALARRLVKHTDF